MNPFKRTDDMSSSLLVRTHEPHPEAIKFFLEFTTDESCGKCPPCRVGTKVMLEMLEAITKGKGEPGDIETLNDLSREIIDTSPS